MGKVETAARRLALSNRLKNIIQSSRNQLQNITGPHEFQHDEPIPHKVVIDKDRNGKPCLVLSFDNTDSKIASLVVETSHTNTQGLQFQEINFVEPGDNCQIEIPFVGELGTVDDVKIQSVIYEGEELDFFGTNEEVEQA